MAERLSLAIWYLALGRVGHVTSGPVCEREIKEKVGAWALDAFICI